MSNIIELDPTAFMPFPKMARLSRNSVITEKLDGTNGQILITEDGKTMKAGSRNRRLSAGADNYGFHRWAVEHYDELLTLGPGRHFGEWWGAGIQRGYGLTGNDKRFSLFNVNRWCLHGTEPKCFPTADPRVIRKQLVLPPCVGLVPVLAEGLFSDALVSQAMNKLIVDGSAAAPGFMKPEGIVIYHEAAGLCFKKTIENDESPKSKV